MTVPIVAAAVMTYNRCELLRRCLLAVRDQTMRPTCTLVIDNASIDATARMLSQEFPEITVHRTTENLGSAGAIQEALRVALATAPTYIWLLDDDLVPYRSCLETLVREMQTLQRDRRIGALRPTLRDPITGRVFSGGIGVGAIIRSDVVTQVGLPTSELFMELIDRNYRFMIERAGYEVLRLPVVLAEHPAKEPRSLRQLIASGYRVKPWRLYYAIRSRVYFSVYVHHSPWRFLRYLAIAARTLVLLTLFGRPRRGQSLVLKGVVDGVMARMGRRVDPDY